MGRAIRNSMTRPEVKAKMIAMQKANKHPFRWYAAVDTPANIARAARFDKNPRR